MKQVDAIDLAMTREKLGHDFYLDATETTNNPSGQKVFHWLARQEQTHFNALKRLRDALVRDAPEEAEQSLTSSKTPQWPIPGEVTESTNAQEALQMAIEAEKASVSFYRTTEQFTPDEGAKTMFSELVREEQKHLQLLEIQLDALIRGESFIELNSPDVAKLLHAD